MKEAGPLLALKGRRVPPPFCCGGKPLARKGLWADRKLGLLQLTALPYGDDVKTQLTRQMISPVLWARTVENMVAAGVDTFIECGPGRVLSGLIARITDKARVLNVEDEETLKQTLSEVLSC